MRRYNCVLGALVLTVIAAGCSEESLPGDDTDDRACQAACEHARNVCQTGTGTVDQCVNDCLTEPWPQNYIDCRTATCETEAVCESWGTNSSCQEACEHARNVCQLGSGTTEECVTDCMTEPWPQHYINCRATTCETEATCETWPG